MMLDLKILLEVRHLISSKSITQNNNMELEKRKEEKLKETTATVNGNTKNKIKIIE